MSSVSFNSPEAAGLPLRSGAARFAVGSPDGISSNSWRCWTEKSGIYIACRDNFSETKISLHTSGRWRMGFTQEAVDERPDILAGDFNDRAWDKWEEPAELKPGVVVAFRMVFPTSELAVGTDARRTKKWKDTVFFEAGLEGSGMMTCVTILLTEEDRPVEHETLRSIHLASFPVVDGRRAQVVAHAEPEGDMHEVIAQAKSQAFERMASAGVSPPEKGYFYFHGIHSDGVRYFVGAQT
jgi:hypothetical protein